MAKILFEYVVVCEKCGNEVDVEIREVPLPTQLAVKPCEVCKKEIRKEIKDSFIEKLIDNFEKLGE